MVRIDQGQGVRERVRGGSGERVRRIQRLWSQLAGFYEGAGSSYGEVTSLDFLGLRNYPFRNRFISSKCPGH